MYHNWLSSSSPQSNLPQEIPKIPTNIIHIAYSINMAEFYTTLRMVMNVSSNKIDPMYWVVHYYHYWSKETKMKSQNLKFKKPKSKRNPRLTVLIAVISSLKKSGKGVRPQNYFIFFPVWGNDSDLVLHDMCGDTSMQNSCIQRSKFQRRGRGKGGVHSTQQLTRRKTTKLFENERFNA